MYHGPGSLDRKVDECHRVSQNDLGTPVPLPANMFFPPPSTLFQNNCLYLVFSTSLFDTLKSIIHSQNSVKTAPGKISNFPLKRNFPFLFPFHPLSAPWWCQLFLVHRWCAMINRIFRGKRKWHLRELLERDYEVIHGFIHSTNIYWTHNETEMVLIVGILTWTKELKCLPS